WSCIPLLPLYPFSSPATLEFYTLSLHDALPICPRLRGGPGGAVGAGGAAHGAVGPAAAVRARPAVRDRGGLVVVAGGVGAHGVLADPRGTARGRRPGRPRGDRRGAAAGPQGQVGGEGVDARRRVP